MYHKLPLKRYAHILEFLQSVLPAPATILDLGVRNPFSEIMEQHGYRVINTEGEDWQFDWLLQKSGWELKKTDKWTSPINKIGFRPILRIFAPRYYIAYAEKKSSLCE